MKTYRWIACVLLVVIPWSVRADRVDSFTRQQMHKLHIPGLSLLVLQKDKVRKRAAYGEANLEWHVITTPDTLFETGSIGKCFTATVVMQLVEEGKLSLTDPVHKYFKEAPESWSRITLQNLLSHTSGLPDYALVPGLSLTERWTMHDWLERIPKLPLDFEPGTTWAYSNTNYVVLGQILERMLGKDWYAILNTRVFKPLGMKQSLLADESQILEKRASGYFAAPSQLLNAPSITLGGGDGGLTQTTDDLARFEAGLRVGKLVKPETLQLMQTPFRLSSGRKAPYGLGWFVRDVGGPLMLSHGGNTAGFSASIARWPEQNLTVLVLCNVHNVRGDELAQKIAALYAPEIGPKHLPEAPDPDPAFSARLRAALERLARRELPPEQLDAEYVRRLATPRGQMAMTSLKPFQEMQTFAFLQIEPNAPDRIYRYRVRTQGATFVVAFTVTTLGQIYQVAAREE